MAERTATILAAGEGSRLASLGELKPFVKVGGTSLTDRLWQHLVARGFTDISIALPEEAREKALTGRFMLADKEVEPIYLRTRSSLHTLERVLAVLPTPFPEHLFVFLIDTVIARPDFERWISYCDGLRPEESAICVTRYVDDETPLRVRLDESGNVEAIGKSAEGAETVSSGLFCFSRGALELVPRCVKLGTERLRNYLGALVESGLPLKGLEVGKTVDVDRPEDIGIAEAFLQAGD